MFKKLFVVIFIIYAFFAYEVAITFSGFLDTSKIISGFDQPGYSVNQLSLSSDLGGARLEQVIETLVQLSDKHQVNVFLRERNPASLEETSIRNRQNRLYVYLQDDYYLTALPVRDLTVQTAEEMNQANGVISNGKSPHKLGHLITTTPQLYEVAPLKSILPHQVIDSVYITHTNAGSLGAFRREMQTRFPQMGLEVSENDQYMQFYSSRQHWQGPRILLMYAGYLNTNLLIATIFLLLTTVIYLFNAQRIILIEKLHGLSNRKVFWNQILPLLRSALTWAVPLSLGFHLLFNGNFNIRLLTVFGFYLWGLVVVVLVFLLFCSFVYLYITRLQPVALIKRFQSNTVLIGTSFVIKAITVPLIILSLASSAHSLTSAISMRQKLSAYISQYGHYARLVGTNSPGEYIFDEEGNTYIHKVYHALSQEELTLFFLDDTHNYSDLSLDTIIGIADINFVHKNKLRDSTGNVLKLEPSKPHILVPESKIESLVEALVQSPIHLSSFYPALPSDFNPFTASPEQVRKLAEEAAQDFVIIEDHQPVPPFHMFNPDYGVTIDNYILLVNRFWHHRPGNAADIFIDTRGMTDYEKAVSEALAKHGLPLNLKVVRVSETLEHHVKENQAKMLKAFRESLVYLILLTYISYLTIFFYFKSMQHQVAVKVLHGHPLFGQFRGMFTFNLLLDTLVFVYLIVRGSYMGINVLFGIKDQINTAFAVLLVLDASILFLSIMSFKSSALQNILKRNE